MYTAPYEETYSVPPIVDAEDLWRLAHQLSMQVTSSFDLFQFHTKFFFILGLKSVPIGILINLILIILKLIKNICIRCLIMNKKLMT